jgi:hypothetical protein
MRIEPGTRHPYRLAVEARDGEAMAKALHPDVEFHAAPFREPVRGRDNVLLLLAALSTTFKKIEFTDEPWGETTYVFTVRVSLEGGHEIEIVDHVQSAEDGLVKRVTTFARPLESLQVVAERLSETHAELTSQ